MESIKVALVDDHKLFRSGLSSLINNFPGYKVIIEAGNGRDLIEKINSKVKPDLVLLDINMPEMDGFATIKWLQQNYPEIHVIIISMFEGEENVIALIRSGAKGYLMKDAEPQEFKQALDTVAASQVYYPPFVTRYLIHNLHHPATSNHVKLNDREKEFLKLTGTEFTYKEMADRMNVSVRTIDGYRDQLFQKLNVKSRVGLVLYAIKNKLVEL
ncbi:MAG: response regulator transcription factor [Pyrinomonadaceae bacterium]|nr:response regulator transcription factor [Sphingobacteriaceae bacterium]